MARPPSSSNSLGAKRFKRAKLSLGQAGASGLHDELSANATASPGTPLMSKKDAHDISGPDGQSFPKRAATDDVPPAKKAAGITRAPVARNERRV